jgi:hypothetical protein
MVMLACLLAAVLVCAAARSASFIHLEIYDRADGGYQQQAHKQFLHHFLPYINVFLDSIYISCLPLPYPGSPFTPPIPRLTFYQFPPSQFALFHLPGFQVSIFQVSQHPLFFPVSTFPASIIYTEFPRCLLQHLTITVLSAGLPILLGLAD